MDALISRLFICACCARQVTICPACDRGHRYCGPDCARTMRRQAVAAAGKRYQGTFRGRSHHAARQCRYRARQQKVTHQGSAATTKAASFAASKPVGAVTPAPAVEKISVNGLRCHVCGRLCADFVHLDTRARRAHFAHPELRYARRVRRRPDG